MNRRTFGLIVLSSYLLCHSIFGAEKRIDYNVADFEEDMQRVKRVMAQIIKARDGKPPTGYEGLTTVQHVEGKKYLIRGENMPVEAAIIPGAESVLADGTYLRGYFLPTSETFSYTTITGAKATVKVSEFRDEKYPFESEANFIAVLKTGVTFYCFGDPVDCDKCTGWGKVKAKTPSGWQKCSSCDGKGKVPVRYVVVWKKSAEKPLTPKSP